MSPRRGVGELRRQFLLPQAYSGAKPSCAWMARASGSLALHIAITIHVVLRNRMVCQRTGTAQTITPFSRLLAAERPLTTPDEGGWGGIPATRAGFQPLDELFGSARLLSRQGTTHQNPLDGLRHINGMVAPSLKRH